MARTLTRPRTPTVLARFRRRAAIKGRKRFVGTKTPAVVSSGDLVQAVIA